MRATKWYRRAGAETQYEGSVTPCRYGSKPEEIHLNLKAYEGDDVNRLKITLSLKEAEELRDSLALLLRPDDERSPRQKWVDEKKGG